MPQRRCDRRANRRGAAGVGAIRSLAASVCALFGGIERVRVRRTATHAADGGLRGGAFMAMLAA